MDRLRESWSLDSLLEGRSSMWRYAPALPVQHETSIISLGEGMTPILTARRTGKRIGAVDLLVKDDGLNPTGSYKARGLSCAISMCVELGIGKVTISSRGNAASALAAYAAAAGIEARIFLPSDVPQANFVECRAFGAQVILGERKDEDGWFDLTTPSEPYRIEGKKTAGFEIAEQLGWELPDAILYPTGSGLGMTGMWKAFAELEALGWIGAKRPKMIGVQPEGRRSVDLQAVRESGGTLVPVPGEHLIDAGIRLASDDGIFVEPEGAACVVAAERLLREGLLKREDKIVIYNTGSGLKHWEAYSTRFPRAAAGETDKLGGLITPR
jgi:threonine synthase